MLSKAAKATNHFVENFDKILLEENLKNASQVHVNMLNAVHSI